MRKWPSLRWKLHRGDVLGGVCLPPREPSGSALLSGTSDLLQKWENKAVTCLPTSSAAKAGNGAVPQASSRQRSPGCWQGLPRPWVSAQFAVSFDTWPGELGGAPL